MKKLLTVYPLATVLCGAASADTIWSEDFSSYVDVGITGLGPTNGYSDVSISVDTSETGSGTTPASKYVLLFYKLNDGAEIPFSINPTNSGNWTAATATQTGLAGSTVQIIARVNNTYASTGSNLAIFDNVIVTGTPGAPSISRTFDFLNDADLYGALSGETGPVAYTNDGLTATFTASAGTMNRTAGGFGVGDAFFPGGDPDGFDIGEWIDIITFDTEVKLTDIVVSNWEPGTDQVTIYVDEVSQGIITSAGDHPFDIFVSTGQVLSIECTDVSAGIDGWSLDSITVLPYTPFPPVLEAIGDREVIVSNSLSFTVTATDENIDDIILSVSNLPPGAVFNTVTNAGAVTNTFTWASAAPIGEYDVTFIADDGITKASETITITVKERPLLLISEVADPAGTGGGNYRFVELWNSGTNTIDLAADNWHLSMQDNGDPGDWRDLALTGSIGPTGTYVVAYSTTYFLAAYDFEPDQESATVVAGNGRDTYALFYGGDHASGVLIDIYGGTNTISWYAVSGRRYTVLWTSSLTDVFQPQVTVDAPTNSWTDTTHTTATNSFYKLEVQEIP